MWVGRYRVGRCRVGRSLPGRWLLLGPLAAAPGVVGGRQRSHSTRSGRLHRPSRVDQNACEMVLWFGGRESIFLLSHTNQFCGKSGVDRELPLACAPLKDPRWVYEKGRREIGGTLNVTAKHPLTAPVEPITTSTLSCRLPPSGLPDSVACRACGGDPRGRQAPFGGPTLAVRCSHRPRLCRALWMAGRWLSFCTPLGGQHAGWTPEW